MKNDAWLLNKKYVLKSKRFDIQDIITIILLSARKVCL